ncbi:MAG TPA: hypothetical protein ENO09_01985 [bacterium]|nr:hypothetical protein [bacterium]
MKTPALITASLIAGSLCVASPLFAAPIHDPVVNAHQHRQHARIQHGVHSGPLTRSETCALPGQQHALRQQKRSYKSDGIMTHAERRDMRRDQHVSHRAIYNEKHDADIQARLAE